MLQQSAVDLRYLGYSQSWTCPILKYCEILQYTTIKIIKTSHTSSKGASTMPFFSQGDMAEAI
jgi:hypothetical protein